MNAEVDLPMSRFPIASNLATLSAVEIRNSAVLGFSSRARAYRAQKGQGEATLPARYTILETLGRPLFSHTLLFPQSYLSE